MKKFFLSALVCLISTVAISCGKKAEEKSSTNLQEFKAPQITEIDTLSYIVGMDVANSNERNIIPMFKVDYNIMMSALVQALDPNATIEIEGESFNKANFREVGNKYMSNELQGRVMAAMNDSTAQIYNDEK